MYVKFESELRDYLENPAKKFNKFVKEFLPRGKKEMLLLNKKAEEGRDRLLEFNSQNSKISGELLVEAQKMDSNEELLPFAFNMLERLDIDVQKGIYPNSYVLKGEPGQLAHATLLGVENTRNMENGEILEFDGCSITVATSRESVLNYENVKFFFFFHPIMQRLFDSALNEDFGDVACVSDFVPGGKILAQYNFILEFSVNTHWGINNMLNERFLSVVLDSTGNTHNGVLEKVKNAKNSQIANIHNGILEYFATEGLKKAKSSLEDAVKKVAKEAEKQAISVLESELHRLEETYMLLRDFEIGKLMDKKKRDIIACKKSLASPKLRLDGVRVII
jgi:ATP-dependent helicase HepA